MILVWTGFILHDPVYCKPTMDDIQATETRMQGHYSQEQYGNRGRPYVRWWWFASEIRNEDIDRQIEWIRNAGFGGVELAFVYPSNNTNRVYPFLGPEWQTAVAYCARACGTAGMGFDLTFGSLWPFGGSMVGAEDASQTHAGLSLQRLSRSWELGEGKSPAYIVNHLDRGALRRYASVVGPAMRPALETYAKACVTASAGTHGLDVVANSPPCLFCDSWEVHVEGLWTDGFGECFAREFGYRIEPYMPRLDEEPDVRYDYRRLLSRLVLEEFYQPFAEVCHEHDALARVQCHGAPTDLIAAYAAVDVPESETLLFDPPFSAIAASAAAQSGAGVVSCEAFTCLYGWRRWPGPGPYHGEECWQDIRMTADAMFSSGVNHVVWHGMPFSNEEAPQRFYATVHVGPDASFAAELPALNAYFANVCCLMQEGRTWAPLAVYQPLEDMFRLGELADEDRRPSAFHHWEMQYLRFPHETLPYRPVWTSEHFLASARVTANGAIELGSHRVSALYVASEYLHPAVLEHLLRIARAGGTVVLTRDPKQPGRARRPGYTRLLLDLRAVSLESLQDVPPGRLEPVVAGDELPDFWARELEPDGHRTEPVLRLFFAHPLASRIRYPMAYRYSDEAAPAIRDVVIRWKGIERRERLEFGRCEALLLELGASGAVVTRRGNDMICAAGQQMPTQR